MIYIRKQVKYQEMFMDSNFQQRYDPAGIWAFDPENHTITRQKVPGQNHVGDIRISYYVPEGFGVDRTKIVSVLGRQH